MHSNVQQTLQDIGYQLDNNIYPVVKNGGVIMPCELSVTSNMGEETKDEKRTSRRSKTRAWKRTTRRQRPSNKTTSLICTDIQTQYESELDAVYKAYPKTQVWYQQDGLILLTESEILFGLNRPATFLVVIPYAKNLVVKGWGFWVGSIDIDWIGPRHTNFPDGSICAFEPSDATWTKSDSLVELLDLYSFWALRHLYLKIYGRWPGQQAVQFPYERILELRSDEYCGCKQSDKLYAECCQRKDLKNNHVANAVNFILSCSGGHRKPPETIINFIHRQSNPPKIVELISV
ncbi:MAG TPA: hypothetical protein ENI98_08830 [Gammaproteobacteria bacterium]|nr:hypothetical protein [Gammaproteobacteria bacterium]